MTNDLSDHLALWKAVADQRDSYWYLATPYSEYAAGIQQAAEDACRAAALLIRHGVPVFSPIAHSHWIAIHGDIEPTRHDLWLPADAPLMGAACGLIVVRMPGWEQSYGVDQEIKAFRAARQPIYYMEWPI